MKTRQSYNDTHSSKDDVKKSDLTNDQAYTQKQFDEAGIKRRQLSGKKNDGIIS